MKNLAFGFALVLLAGCAAPSSSNNAADDHAGHSHGAAPSAGSAQGTPLGTEVVGARYRVTLRVTPESPAVGTAKFTASVAGAKEGTTVHVQLSMPGMNMSGPGIDMKSVGNGAFEGTAKLPMAGEYQAEVHLSGPDGPETAIYTFGVRE
jgi:hypothetical protein